MFIAGTIHAYTSSFGVEIMASSANVLRAGLTGKHADRRELLDATNFTLVPGSYRLPGPISPISVSALF
jgi:mannose-6-phosphate isomerase